MAAALTGITSDDHIRHHLIDPSILFKVLILKDFPEKTQEDRVFKAFFFVPVPIPFVFAELAEGSLDDSKGQLSLDMVVPKDLCLNDLLSFSLHC